MWNSPAKTWEEALSTTSREHKGRWTGHILRRDQTNVACHALDCSPQGNHQKGWPVMTWALSVYHQQRAQGKIDRTHPVQGPMSPNQRCMSCSGLQPLRQPPKGMTSHDLGTEQSWWTVKYRQAPGSSGPKQRKKCRKGLLLHNES